MPFKDYLSITKPTKSKDIVGNNTLIQNLKQEISSGIPKGILISGPTGIGKTLSLKLIFRELDSDDIWYDAADLDSKKIESIDLHGENIESLFFDPRDSREKIFVIDNADGFPEKVNKSLISKIKTTKNIIIILCNDPYPLRDIEKYCTVFKFIRPSKIQIKNFLFKSNIFKESTDASKNEKIHTKIENLITETNNDIRFLLNTLSLKITHSDKDKIFNTPFDATSTIFDSSETLSKKMDAFYFDTFIIPLMVHENYISKTGKAEIKYLINYANSAEDLSQGDIFNKNMFTETNGYQAIMVIRAANNHRVGFPSFTKMLGNESSTNSKIKQLCTLGFDRLYASALIYIIAQKIIKNDFKEVISLMNKYSLTKDQYYDFLLPLWINKENPVVIPSKEKAAFTRYCTSLTKKKTYA